MNINIRENIVHNFKDSNEDSIRQSITDAITSKDEIVLPGLGVFFEILWNNCTDIEKNNILTTLKINL